jgi:hypothetical protein
MKIQIKNGTKIVRKRLSTLENKTETNTMFGTFMTSMMCVGRTFALPLLRGVLNHDTTSIMKHSNYGTK